MAQQPRSAGIAVGVRLTRVSLRILGFRATITLLGTVSRLGGSPATAADVSFWVASIDRAARRRFGASCLDRSVFLWFLMRRRQVEADIRIGIAFEGNRLDGHAWVESGGKVINDDPDIADRFAVFDEDPAGIVFS